MAITYVGVIAGIGDKQEGINVIYPEFDAQLRKFEVGKNTILSGFDYNEKTGYLSAGYCLAEGYVGASKEDITINKSDYVYGVFVVNHDKNVPDSFNLEIHDRQIESLQQDDILNEAGKYYFQIYPSSYPVYMQTETTENVGEVGAYSTITKVIDSRYYIISGECVDDYGTVQTDLKFIKTGEHSYEVQNPTSMVWTEDVYARIKINVVKEYIDRPLYPAKAEYSDYATIVEEDGVLKDGVTCTTQDANDNSDKVASTKYVHKQIEEEIGYKTIKDTFTNSNTGGTYTSLKSFTGSWGGIQYRQDVYLACQMKRKSRLCVGRINIYARNYKISDGGFVSVVGLEYAGGEILGKIPIEFAPKETKTYIFLLDGTSSAFGTPNIKIDTNGDIIVVGSAEIHSGTNPLTTQYDMGYETN